MGMTSTQFLASVKRGVTIPTYQNRFSDQDFYSFGDEETETVLLPIMTSQRQEYYVTKIDTPIVTDQSEYKIFKRFIGRTLRTLWYTSLDGTYVQPLSKIELEDASAFQCNVFGQPWQYMVIGDKFIVPNPGSTTGYLTQYGELAPSKITATDNVATITSFDLTSGAVTVDAAASVLTTGSVVDIIDGSPGYSVKAIGISLDNAAGTSYTFTADTLPADLAIGDYISLANTTPVLQMPNELNQVLVQAVICRLLEAQSDFEGWNVAKDRLKEKLTAAQELITPRVESDSPVIFNRNGLLQRRSANYRFRYIP